ncbi:MAG: RNA methyltransferase, partial [Desulfomonilia bacterium]|nr:RNA methyltransferase [Desulfomonilia bacterium]
KTLLGLKRGREVMMLEGRRLVEDALLRGLIPRMVAVTADHLDSSGEPGCGYVIISEKLFAALSDTSSPQGILAFFPLPWADMVEVRSLEKLVILDGIQDPGNVGTIIRTAEAFGFSGMIVMEGTANPFLPKAVRSSMGSCLGVRIARGTLDDLEHLPHSIISLVPSGRANLSPGIFSGKVALCFGQEASGVREEVLRLSRDTVKIPMQGRTESLNVAVAAGIVLACAAGSIQEYPLRSEPPHQR